MKCEGCGIEIQSKDPNKAGYVPENVIIEKLANDEPIVCQRCFKLRHYNQLLPINIDSDFSCQIDKILKDFKTVIWLVDVIDFEGTFRKEILDKLKGKNVFLVVNKIDLLPRSTSYTQLKEWLYERIKDSDLKIPKEHIRMISVKNGVGMERTKKLLIKSEREKALIIGVVNVGKSSFLKKLGAENLTVSSYPGTTLNVLRTKINNMDLEFYDTPGIFTKDRLCDFFDIYSQVKMIPSKKIISKTFTVNKGNVLFISGLFWIKVIENGINDLPPIMTVFHPEGVSTHRAKQERVDELLTNRDVLFPPYYSSFKYEKVNFENIVLRVDKGNDIAIAGGGWISIKRGPLIAEIIKPKELKVIIRKSIK
ncbi:GTPase [Petrotoga sp. 9PWA.NaAc.5.4]|uniref:GTPase n=1 Tax=Petrotoga sp. 9PWA.NaAc.5.4 TaxID=1434328 RepID=UPI000CB25C81|nr:GTPase [Petrotoga sp. 9PWA.NaAc.5.4]PNR96716.1 ribosome biogenesis GTPase YqeH [Petrotoga sp. 9PWA.NaAc.5.4]